MPYGQSTRNEQAEPPKHFWTLTRTVQLTPNGLLPPRFPFIVDDETGFICEPALIFLYENFIKYSAHAFVKNTVDSYAHDLKDWWNFLEEFCLNWDTATSADLSNYCRVMTATRSPLTGEVYSIATIKRRKSTIEQFYSWARNNLQSNAPLPIDGLLNPINNTSIRLNKRPSDDHVSFLRFAEAKNLFECIGPLPSEIREHCPSTTSSYRLCCEIALNVGLRIAEVAFLNLPTFRISTNNLSSTQSLRIKVIGKGSKARMVDVPVWLLNEIQHYIHGERAQITSQISKTSDQLFLYGFRHRLAGNPISIRSIQRAFWSACLESGLSRTECGLLQKSPKYTFHSLRHTYALWTYYVRKQHSDSEPWLYIQKQLGHSSLETTISTYLRFTNELEAEVSNGYMEFLQYVRY